MERKLTWKMGQMKSEIVTSKTVFFFSLTGLYSFSVAHPSMDTPRRVMKYFIKT